MGPISSSRQLENDSRHWHPEAAGGTGTLGVLLEGTETEAYSNCEYDVLLCTTYCVWKLPYAGKRGCLEGRTAHVRFPLLHANTLA
jgi:hypothetical protein